MAVLANVTIPVGDSRVGLVLLPYEVQLPKGAVIKLDPDSSEDDFGWFTPAEAAQRLATKYTADFCELVAAL